MAKYSLYEAIKDKLSPRQQKILENQMRYNELVGREKRHEEDNL